MTPDERRLRLQPTGRMSVIIEVEGYGPMQIRVDDLDTVLDVIGVLLGPDESGTMTVDSYGKRVEKRLKQVLDGAS